MKVIIKEPGKVAEIKEIEKTLEAKQEIVEGWIEYAPFQYGEEDKSDPIIMICNEEGKFNGSKPNFYNKYLADVIFGTVIVLGDSNNGEETDIPESRITEVLDYFEEYSIDF